MVFRRRRDKQRRLTGISVSLTGASLSWETEKAERGRAREVLHRLEDHRGEGISPVRYGVALTCVSSPGTTAGPSSWELNGSLHIALTTAVAPTRTWSASV